MSTRSRKRRFRNGGPRGAAGPQPPPDTADNMGFMLYEDRYAMLYQGDGMLMQYEFVEEDLFLAGNAGAYFNPANSSKMFQNSNGTTAVTVAGDPIGLFNPTSGAITASQSSAGARPFWARRPRGGIRNRSLNNMTNASW